MLKSIINYTVIIIIIYINNIMMIMKMKTVQSYQRKNLHIQHNQAFFYTKQYIFCEQTVLQTSLPLQQLHQQLHILKFC